MEYDVIESFPEIVPGRTNEFLLLELNSCFFFRKVAVEHLARIEKEDLGFNWWHDEDLMKLFKDLYLAGVVLLPSDPVDRIRWIALTLIKASKTEGFSWGNIVILLDVLPDEMLEACNNEYKYGQGALEEVRKFRTELREKGWKEVFGW